MVMIELPGSLRDFVIERIEEELSGTNDIKDWIRCLFAGLDALAEEIDEDEGENLVSNFEESGELENGFTAMLRKEYGKLRDPSGEDLLAVVDKNCEVAWVSEDGDDEIARGFMDSPGDFDEDEEY
jgi:hypothetical protein